MILADKIIEERKRLGMSQEELADKLSVSRQAVSKWESAQSTPDLGRIIQMADLFGVSTDYLLKDEMEPEDHTVGAASVSESATPRRTVSMEEANEFLAFRKKGAATVALGVLLCVVSPSLLVLLAGLADSHIFGISEGLAAGLGMAFLFCLIAPAVALFIMFGIKASHFSYLEHESFETAYGVSGMAKEKQKNYEPTFAKGLAFGTILCIFAALPLIIAGASDAPDYVCVALTALLLLIVAVGVYFLVRVSLVRSSFQILLREGDNAVENRQTKRKVDAINSIYWCVVTAGYLAWSFLSGDWHLTWVVWPIAAVLSAAISAIITLCTKDDSDS